MAVAEGEAVKESKYRWKSKNIENDLLKGSSFFTSNKSIFTFYGIIVKVKFYDFNSKDKRLLQS